MKLICVVFCIILSVSLGDHVLPDEWNSDDYYDYPGGIETSSTETDYISKDLDKFPFDNDEKDENIVDGADALVDYLIEDNRSNSNEKPANNDTPLETDGEPVPDDGEAVDLVKSEEKKDDTDESIGEVPVEAEEPRVDGSEESNDSDDLAVEDDSWGDVVEHEVEPLPVPDNDDLNNILKETREILGEDSGNNFDDQQAEKTKTEESQESQDEIKDMIDEINDMIDNANNDYDEQEAKSDEDVFSENKVESDAEEDTADKVYADLNADLEKLFETFDKLKNDDSEANESNEEVKVDNVKDYEEKYGWPYKEASVLGERDYDYDNIEDSNLSDIFKDNADDTAAEDTDSIEVRGGNDESNKETESLASEAESEIEPNVNANIEETKNSNENVDIAEIVTEKTNIVHVVEPLEAEIASEEHKSQEDDDKFDSDLYDESNQDEDMIQEIVPDKQPYGEDGLVDDTQPKEADAEEIEPMDYENGDDSFDNFAKFNIVTELEKTTQNAVSVDELNSAQFEDLMAQFKIAHQEDLDINSEDFDKHIAPVHITLSDEETVVITSPNYPSPYPTNNVIDWIFEGEGIGIELNITDLAINGALGDYLLVKPGGLDESGHDGLIFSYRLNTERKFRYLDVNRMFVRFEAKLGLPMLSSRGFQFSAKMIFPPSEEPAPIPEAEPVVDPPQHTLTLNLAGLTLPQFRGIQEDFLNLIADMASKYISETGIYYGYNSTLEVAQITRSAVCSIHWPDYETCVEVTFGVPLNYGEEELEPRLNAEDLDDMWTTMIGKETFAARLDAMGIKEYVIPNDRTVLTVWLVIAAGVIISMAMLAVALWRFSCFEDYTRMRSFSDTDSIRNEKRNLDLYPTPHQTLPPLYAENEYKWADDKYDDSTRVDMGGFANKSYARDDLFNFDSDEDVIAPRDREGAISSKDIYAV